MFKPGGPRFACLLPSFLSFPLKERGHSVTANIDLETRGQQYTFQRFQVNVVHKKKKKRLCYLPICMFNSVLEVMGNPFINLVLQHLTLCFEVGLSSPGTKTNLSQKEHPKGSVKFTGNAEN